jgi:hypothetical protein
LKILIIYLNRENKKEKIAYLNILGVYQGMMKKQLDLIHRGFRKVKVRYQKSKKKAQVKGIKPPTITKRFYPN